jgi:predicted amidohydrolase
MGRNNQKIASAQVYSFARNTEANILHHLNYIDLAARENVDLIQFPEMSLTGYEMELAKEMAFEENDSKLLLFKERAIRYQMMIVVGAPVRINGLMYIGSFIFNPDGMVYTYTKQFLHTGEEKYFEKGFAHNQVVNWNGKAVSIAICADINNPLHAEQASQQNAALYVAGIFYTPQGINDAYKKLSGYAATYGMQILMANYAGFSYKLESAGRSAYWNNSGMLVGYLTSDNEGLLIVETDTENVTFKTLCE